eukprot:TRINITY_DN25176_c0_g1_i1.p1 TRINITY_DN25176_c0_g1~~TRINITY_DN25176_c0_g1_i1.p1  ORF type:complete len:1240 (-),score=480.91 TRINITY_DN25176_c0_g1_i1:259-3978(-)
MAALSGSTPSASPLRSLAVVSHHEPLLSGKSVASTVSTPLLDSRSVLSSGRYASPTRAAEGACRSQAGGGFEVSAGDGGRLRSRSTASLESRLKEEKERTQYPRDFGTHGGTDMLQRRMQEIVDDELAHERRRQVEDLSAKAGSLERDVLKAKGDLDATERQYQVLIEDARHQLGHVRSEQMVMQQEVSHLEGQLRAQRQLGLAAHEKECSRLGEELAAAESSCRTLLDQRKKQEAQVEAARAESSELRRQIDHLYKERSYNHEESLTVSHATKALRDSLEEARRQLDDSERRRAQLRDRYLCVGQQFEDAIERSEKESQLLISELQADLNHVQGKYDKYRQRVDTIESEISVEEACARAAQSAFEERSAEAVRLRRSLEGERAVCSQQELRYSQCKQQRSVEKTPDLQQMIQVSMHQKLLEEQAKHFRERSQELEKRLKAEFQVRPVQLPPPGQQQERRPEHGGDSMMQLQDAAAPAPWPVPGGRRRNEPRPVPANASAARQALHRAAKAEVGKRFEARTDGLEAELRELRQAQRTLEAGIGRSEEQARVLRDNFQEASAHMGRLQRMVDDESKAERDNRLRLQQVIEETSAAKSELSAQSAKLRKIKADSAQHDKMAQASTELAEHVRELEGAREKWRAECQSQSLEASAVRGELQSCTSQLELSESQAERLDRERTADEAKLHRLREALSRMQYVVQAHAAEERSRLQLLRADAGGEVKRLLDRCQDFGNQLNAQVQGQRQRARLDELAVKKSQEDMRRRLDQLEQRCEGAAAESSRLLAELQEQRSSELQHAETLTSSRASLASQTMRIERLLNVAGASLPCTKRFEEAKASCLASPGLDGPMLPELLAALKEGIQATHDRAASSAAANEKTRCQVALKSELQERASAASSKQQALEAELRAAERQREQLRQEVEHKKVEQLRREEQRAEAVRTHAEEVKTRVEQLTEKSAALEVELASEEAKLAEAEKCANEEEAAARALAERLQQLDAERPLALELARSDAAEPLKQRLQSLLAEVDELRKSFQEELQEMDRVQKERCAREMQALADERSDLEARLKDEAELLRRSLQDERSAEAAAAEDVGLREAELQKQLAKGRLDLADKEAEMARLEDQSSQAAQEEERARAAVQVAEAKVADVQRQREKAQSEAAESRAELLRRQEHELAELRRSRDAEVSRLRRRLQHSISGLSAVGPDEKDISAVTELDSSDFLRSPDDPIVGRARRNLGLTSPGLA